MGGQPFLWTSRCTSSGTSATSTVRAGRTLSDCIFRNAVCFSLVFYLCNISEIINLPLSPQAANPYYPGVNFRHVSLSLRFSVSPFASVLHCLAFVFCSEGATPMVLFPAQWTEICVGEGIGGQYAHGSKTASSCVWPLCPRTRWL